MEIMAFSDSLFIKVEAAVLKKDTVLITQSVLFFLYSKRIQQLILESYEWFVNYVILFIKLFIKYKSIEKSYKITFHFMPSSCDALEKDIKHH